MDELYPNDDNSDLVPSPDEIDTAKLSKGVINTDTCNAAQKFRRILVEHIPGAYEYDCMHHLRNIWVGSAEKDLTSSLNTLLRDSLDEIDPKLRVSTSISAIIRAIDKEFSLSANYPKGHGALFAQFMLEYHPGALLLHVERASGSRQDLCTEGSLPIYMNYEYYLEFLDMMLRRRTKDGKASILQKNLFVVLSSSEMIALTRLLSILHLSIVMPFRWLAGKTHELAHHNWSPLSMSRVLDTLDEKLATIKANPKLILNQRFMMDIFKEYREELPEFKEYWEDTFKKRQMSVVARKSGTKVMQFKEAVSHLFNPTRKTDKDTRNRVIELAKVATNSLITELHDKNKATYKYLSISNSDMCYKNCSEEMKKDFLGKKATNDEAESALGATTYEIQKGNRIGITNAAAVSDLNRNGFVHRQTSKKDKKSEGLFHQFHEKLRHAIVLVAMRDAPATKAQNDEDLELQLKAKNAKEKIAKRKNMENATEAYIEGLYYRAMYDSEACAKGDTKHVKENLNRLTSDTAKYRFLKENITIRVKGFGWDWCKHAWSKGNRKYTINELAAHLRYIITREKTMDIPDEPTPEIQKRTDTAILGTLNDFAKNLDAKYFKDKDEFKKACEKLKREREARGEGSMYSTLQPFFRPELDELVGRRIDVLSSFEIKNEDGSHKEWKLRWCQGEVKRVYDNRKKPTVRVLWDAMPDCDGYEQPVETDQVLLQSKWNKEVDGAWRMDIEIAIDDDNEDEEMADVNESSSIDESEVSESEMSESESEEEGIDDNN